MAESTNTTNLSRRAMLGRIPAAVLATTAIPPIEAIASAYPALDAEILALSAATLAAWEYFGETCRFDDDVAAREEGRLITPEQRQIHKDADAEHERLRWDLLTSAPKTNRGVRAVFEYLRRDPYLDGDEIKAFAEAMLASDALAA